MNALAKWWSFLAQVWQALREGRIPPLAAGQAVLGRETARGTAGRGRSSNASRPDG